jgi:hypothetical protein
MTYATHALRIELEQAQNPRLDTLERQLAWAVLRGGRVAALALRDRLTETDGAVAPGRESEGHVAATELLKGMGIG